MWHFKRWSRLKQSRGYGIHSQFAFNLITNVLYQKNDYYAFHDIPKILREHGLQSCGRSDFNQLSFRLVNHFKSKRILEINSGMGVNTCYLTSVASDIHCTCVEKDMNSVEAAKKLLAGAGSRCEFVTGMKKGSMESYDAIFIGLKEKESMPDLSVESLLQLSHENTFWIIYPITGDENKQFWSDIVKDERINITFDLKTTGIALLRHSFYKMNYMV
ncbi:MAG: hypothetical protein LLF80_02765 [Porphyromonadaceae bacterium]|nr:hypothetical protein [Porphyromonadaceae bacterium]